MSVRRRNVTNRLSQDLTREREAHGLTNERLKRSEALAAHLAQHFASDPPAPLSRESGLFLLLKELVPGAIPVLPPTPREMLETILKVAGLSLKEAPGYLDPVR